MLPRMPPYRRRRRLGARALTDAGAAAAAAALAPLPIVGQKRPREDSGPLNATMRSMLFEEAHDAAAVAHYMVQDVDDIAENNMVSMFALVAQRGDTDYTYLQQTSKQGSRVRSRALLLRCYAQRHDSDEEQGQRLVAVTHRLLQWRPLVRVSQANQLCGRLS